MAFIGSRDIRLLPKLSIMKQREVNIVVSDEIRNSEALKDVMMHLPLSSWANNSRSKSNSSGNTVERNMVCYATYISIEFVFAKTTPEVPRSS